MSVYEFLRDPWLRDRFITEMSLHRRKHTLSWEEEEEEVHEVRRREREQEDAAIDRQAFREPWTNMNMN